MLANDYVIPTGLGGTAADVDVTSASSSGDSGQDISFSDGSSYDIYARQDSWAGTLGSVYTWTMSNLPFASFQDGGPTATIIWGGNSSGSENQFSLFKNGVLVATATSVTYTTVTGKVQGTSNFKLEVGSINATLVSAGADGMAAIIPPNSHISMSFSLVDGLNDPGDPAPDLHGSGGLEITATDRQGLEIEGWQTTSDTHGTVNWNADHTQLVYMPDSDYAWNPASGEPKPSFTYTIRYNGQVLEKSATVTIDVQSSTSSGGTAGVGWEGGTLWFILNYGLPDSEVDHYEIDVNNDGTFDVQGTDTDLGTPGGLLLDIDKMSLISSPMDDGSFPGKMRVWKTDGSHIDQNFMTVIGNIFPGITLNYDISVGISSLFVVSAAVDDPGDDTIISTTVDWGDGVVESYSGLVSSLSHSYQVAGFYSAVISVTDEDCTNSTIVYADVGEWSDSETSPVVESATVAIGSNGTVTIEIAANDGNGGSVDTYEYDLDGDGQYEYAGGSQIQQPLTPDSGGNYRVGVRVTANGRSTEECFVFFEDGVVVPNADWNANTYYKKFLEGTPELVPYKDLVQIHHTIQQGGDAADGNDILTQRFLAAGKNIHTDEYLRAMPKAVHSSEVARFQNGFWRKMVEKYNALDGVTYTTTTVKARVDLDLVEQFSDDMKAMYDNEGIAVKYGANKANVQAWAKKMQDKTFWSKFAKNLPDRVKSLAKWVTFSAKVVAFIGLFSGGLYALSNIASPNAEVAARYEAMIITYTTCLSELERTDTLKKNTFNLMAEAFAAYGLALGLNDTAIGLTQRGFAQWAETNCVD